MRLKRPERHVCLNRLKIASAVPLGLTHDMLTKSSLKNSLAGGKFASVDRLTHPVR